MIITDPSYESMLRQNPSRSFVSCFLWTILRSRRSSIASCHSESDCFACWNKEERDFMNQTIRKGTNRILTTFTLPLLSSRRTTTQLQLHFSSKNCNRTSGRISRSKTYIILSLVSISSSWNAIALTLRCLRIRRRPVTRRIFESSRTLRTRQHMPESPVHLFLESSWLLSSGSVVFVVSVVATRYTVNFNGSFLFRHVCCCCCYCCCCFILCLFVKSWWWSTTWESRFPAVSGSRRHGGFGQGSTHGDTKVRIATRDFRCHWGLVNLAANNWPHASPLLRDLAGHNIWMYPHCLILARPRKRWYLWKYSDR